MNGGGGGRDGQKNRQGHNACEQETDGMWRTLLARLPSRRMRVAKELRICDIMSRSLGWTGRNR